MPVPIDDRDIATRRAALCDYYRTLQARSGSLMPPRAAFRIQDVIQLSLNFSLAEWREYPNYRLNYLSMRISSNNVADSNVVLDCETTYGERNSPLILAAMRASFDGPCGYTFAFAGDMVGSPYALTGLVLPLADNDGRGNYSLVLSDGDEAEVFGQDVYTRFLRTSRFSYELFLLDQLPA